MAENRKNSGKHNLSTEDLLNDYLKDVFGSDTACTLNAKHPEKSTDEEFDEEHIEIQEPDSYVSYEQKGIKHEDSVRYESSNCDEPIVVSDHEFDLLPQERKGAVEKFCVNRVALFHSPDKQVLFSPSQIQVGRNGVNEGRFLVPIIDFNKVVSKRGYRSPEEAHLLLLNSLYYLRRPLPEKVRMSFLNYGEQALDDFHAAKWLAQFKDEALEEE